MTPHSTRLAFLVSLMGVGLSAGSQALAQHESARAEMARVFLALDAAEHAASAAPYPAHRPEPSGARLERLDEPHDPGNAAAVLAGAIDVGRDDMPIVKHVMAEPKPASTDQIDKPAAVLPIQHVLNDLAALRGKSEAGQAEPAHAPWGGDSVAMDASRLDGVRGGFVTHTGLRLSFGIERAVYINGTLVTTTALNVSDLSKLSAGQAGFAGLNGGTLAIVQSGTGNTFLPGAVSASTIGTVIQNTLDNQHIQSVTTINATVNSGEIVRSVNLQQAVQNAITSTLR